jgi:raffinose/stachyose/melibiose transport system permease protein
MKKHDFLAALLFVLPALLIYFFYFVFPIPSSAYYSLFRWNGISPHMQYLGFGNWIRLARDELFWRSFANNLILVVASIGIQLPMGLALGLLVSSRLKGVRFFKLVYFIPMMLSAVAIGITWKFVYEPSYGLLNAALRIVGLGALARGWLGEPALALAAVIATICWEFIPFYLVIFAAALAGVSQELIEAAYIDGASPSVTFFRITLPLLKGTIRTAAILSLTGSLKYFGLIYVMTEGGPNHATELLATYMYKQAFTSFNMGYGSTVAVFMFLISFVLTVVVLRLGKKESPYA